MVDFGGAALVGVACVGTIGYVDSVARRLPVEREFSGRAAVVHSIFELKNLRSDQANPKRSHYYCRSGLSDGER